MKQILVYGDSLGWGMIPGTRGRFPFDQRWPGILENMLNADDHASVRVIENTLPGRRTVWEDPFRPARNGSLVLGEAIEVNSPLALVIVQLGTNDFQAPYAIKAWGAAAGVGKLIDIIRQVAIEPGMPRPPILVMAPTAIVAPKGENIRKFEGAPERFKGLPAALEEVARAKSADYFDMNTVARASTIDGIHLDADQHVLIGRALAPVVAAILERA